MAGCASRERRLRRVLYASSGSQSDAAGVLLIVVVALVVVVVVLLVASLLLLPPPPPAVPLFPRLLPSVCERRGRQVGGGRRQGLFRAGRAGHTSHRRWFMP